MAKRLNGLATIYVPLTMNARLVQAIGLPAGEIVNGVWARQRLNHELVDAVLSHLLELTGDLRNGTDGQAGTKSMQSKQTRGFLKTGDRLIAELEGWLIKQQAKQGAAPAEEQAEEQGADAPTGQATEQEPQAEAEQPTEQGVQQVDNQQADDDFDTFESAIETSETSQQRKNRLDRERRAAKRAGAAA